MSLELTRVANGYTRASSASVDTHDEESSVEALGDKVDGENAPRLASWPNAGWIMVADVVGVGIMGLTSAFAQLGWALAIVSLVAWYVINMYVGLMVAEARLAYPSNSFMDMAAQAFGPTSSAIVGFCVYLFLGMIVRGNTTRRELTLAAWRLHSHHWANVGDDILRRFLVRAALDAFGRALPRAVYTPPPPWCLAPSHGNQRVRACHRPYKVQGTHAPACSIMVIASVTIALGSLAVLGRESVLAARNSRTEFVAASLTPGSFFSAQSMFAFAYMGCTIYLEIISEMRDPADFRRSLLHLSGPVQFVLFLVTGAMGCAPNVEAC